MKVGTLDGDILADLRSGREFSFPTSCFGILRILPSAAEYVLGPADPEGGRLVGGLVLSARERPVSQSRQIMQCG